MNKVILGMILCLMASSIAGCNRDKSTNEEISGVYVAKYGSGTETLILHTNSMFTQVYTSPVDNIVLSNAGTWEHWSDRRAILLRDAVAFDKMNFRGGQPPEKIVMVLGIANRLGRRSLIFGEGGVEEYDKVQ